MGRGIILPTAGEIDISKVRPTGDYLLVKTFEKNETSGGIILPHGERSECRFGEVVASGSGEIGQKSGKLYPTGFCEGNAILVMEYTGEQMEIGEEKYRFLHANGVWARVEFDDPKTLSIKRLYPVTDHILIEIEEEEKSKGGIHLPSAPNLAYARAKVVKVGGPWTNPKTDKFEPIPVVDGDRIIFRRYAGAIVTVDGKKYRIIQTADILCVEEK